MGFFSARRSEENENTLDNDPSVVRVIRSRFYGKPKGKEREVEPSFYTASANAASTASFATNKAADKRSLAGSIRGPRTSTSTSRNWTGSSTASPRRPGNVSDMSGSRSSTDLITVTLAQRLNELATANSEGLLSDDEYRLLRQNLFERFASGSSMPAEAPLVPMSKPAHSTAEPRNSMSHQRRPSSNFHVQTPSLRAASIQSKKSFTSTVTGLLRRATSRRIVSNPPDGLGSDTMSVYSMASSPPERTTLPRRLSKQTSDISLQRDTSSSRLSQSYNRRTVIGAHTFSATDPGPTRTRTRSGSRAPPSAFPGASKATDPAYTHISMSDIPDDDTVESVQDIRHQIELVEAEGRRLLDAFNGLELSTLTRRQRKPPVIPPLPSHGSLTDANWLGGDKRSIRGGKDSDALSFKSNGSGRTTMSMKRSPSIGGKMRTVNSVGTLVSQHAVMRKGSFSSVSSRGRTAPSLPNLASHLGLGSSSSVNLARSTGHLPLETVEETDGHPPRPAALRSAGSKRESRWTETASMGSSNPVSPTSRSDAGSTGTGGRRAAGIPIDEEEFQSMEAELADIRRRRAEVTARYESRLEYLRARLKGAELREKILRK
ncbi:hypothetical protein GY45DRAFT_705054 [Cubamyces sp. BRFM 1775]|nr:hypothetical protein GY45DRAFT_705054 [Cubamyces sp. BRFM 1775]